MEIWEQFEDSTNYLNENLGNMQRLKDKEVRFHST